MHSQLSDRQYAVLREASRARGLVSVVQYPSGRLEDVASSGWDADRVPLPTDAEVRQLVRDGHLVFGERSVATTFYITDSGRRVAHEAASIGAAMRRRA